MSVKRYRFFGQVQEVGESGETIDAGWSVFHPWVKYEDYAALLARYTLAIEQHELLKTSVKMYENLVEGGGLHREKNETIKRLKAATQWRPIETAPKDGTEVLCISSGFMFVAWIDSRGHWNSGDDSRFIPDYWMPLPKPPSA